VHLLGARDRVDHAAREFDLRLVEKEIRGAFRNLRLDRRSDRRMRMTEQGGAGAEVVVNVFAAGDVPDAASGAACDDQVQLGRQHEQPESAAGEETPGVAQQILLVRHAGTVASAGDSLCAKQKAPVEAGAFCSNEASAAQ
jgi:hypothetical protein